MGALDAEMIGSTALLEIPQCPSFAVWFVTGEEQLRQQLER